MNSIVRLEFELAYSAAAVQCLCHFACGGWGIEKYAYTRIYTHIDTYAYKSSYKHTGWQLYILTNIYIYTNTQRDAYKNTKTDTHTYTCCWCPWCNGYRRRKWTRRHEFKSWTRLIVFHTWERYESNNSPFNYGLIVGETELFSFG